MDSSLPSSKESIIPNVCIGCRENTAVHMNLGEMREIGNYPKYSRCTFSEKNLCIDCGTKTFQKTSKCLSNCHKPRSYECDEICRSMHIIKNISTEVSNDHEGNALKCPNCNAVCKNQKTLHQHIQEKCVKREIAFCGICGKDDKELNLISDRERHGSRLTLLLKLRLSEHMLLCSPPSECIHCKQEIGQKLVPTKRNSKTEHERYVCTELGKCKDCENRKFENFRYPGKNGLYDHKMNQCPRNCNKCKLQFEGQSDLDAHINKEFCSKKIQKNRKLKGVWGKGPPSSCKI